jgi:hypothetical protein
VQWTYQPTPHSLALRGGVTLRALCQQVATGTRPYTSVQRPQLSCSWPFKGCNLVGVLLCDDVQHT